MRRSARRGAGASCSRVALVGYTNAGKSTLLNRLTNAGVLVEDQLFSTLDPTTRRLHLPGGETVLLLRHRRLRAAPAAPARRGVPLDARRGRRRRPARARRRRERARDRRCASTRSRPCCARSTPATCRRCSCGTRADLADRDDVEAPRRRRTAVRSRSRRRPATASRICSTRSATGCAALARVVEYVVPVRPRRRARGAAPRGRGARRGARRRRHARAGPAARRVGRTVRRVRERRHPGRAPGTGRLRAAWATTTTPPGSSRRRTRTSGSTRSKRLADSAAGRRRRLLDRHAVRSRCPTSPRARRPPRCRASMGYPASAGSAALRDAAAAWIARRFGVDGRRRDDVGACVGTKELVAVAAAPAAPAQPAARHRAVSRRSRTRPTRWARSLAGCRAVPGRRSTPTGTSTSTRSPRPTPSARSLLWVNEPGNPTGSVGDAASLPRDRGVGARPRHRGRERRVLRRVRTRARDDPRAPASTACSRCTACRSARTSPACACGFYAGDPELVDVPRRDAQARGLHGADADAGGGGRRARRRRPRRRAAGALRGTPQARERRPRRARAGARRRTVRVLPLAARRTTAPTTAGRSRRGSRTRACSCRPAISTVPPAPTTCGSRSCSRPSGSARARPLDVAARSRQPLTEGHGVDEPTTKQVTQLWEAGDAWRDVLPPREAHDRRALGDRRARPRRGPRRRGRRRTTSSSTRGRSTRSSCGSASTRWQIIEAGPFEYVDKLPLKHGYQAAGVRVVPGASARFGAYLAPTRRDDAVAT